jgi:hypothetical protein
MSRWEKRRLENMYGEHMKLLSIDGINLFNLGLLNNAYEGIVEPWS